MEPELLACQTPEEFFEMLVTLMRPEMQGLFKDATPDQLDNLARTSAFAQIIATTFDDDDARVFRWAMAGREQALKKGLGEQFADQVRAAGITGMALDVMTGNADGLALMIDTTLRVPELLGEMRAKFTQTQWTLNDFTGFADNDQGLEER